MRGFLLLVAAVASAQDNRGFVNTRLVAQSFVKNSLRIAKTNSAPVILNDSPAVPRCAIPLLQVTPSKDIDTGILIPMGKDSGDKRMILPTIPVCSPK